MARLSPWPAASPLLLYIRGRGGTPETQQLIHEISLAVCGAPSTILHLDNTVAELRRSPASVEHHHRHHAVVLTKLSLNTRLDRSSRDVIELNVCRTSEVPCVRYLIGRIVKTYDYINRVVITLPLSVYEGTWTTLSPLVAMHHHDLACA